MTVALVRDRRGAPDPALLRRSLLTLAGLPESREDSSAGGYQISTYSGRVQVTWWTQDAFEDEAGQIGVHHRQHPWPGSAGTWSP